MNITEDSKVTAQSVADVSLAGAVDRRTDVDNKQAQIARLLQEIGCDGLLVMQPDNFSWLTSGGMARGTLNEAAHPCLYFSAENRWLLSCNADSQRIFDEEIDGLGFQLKEWPWHWGRSQLLNDLCQGRNVACDQPWGTCKVVTDQLRKLRSSMSEYERACYQSLGQIASHALEATGRTLLKGEPEREIAGQLSHRLLHRGATPVLISVAGDGRWRYYRQPGYTSFPIRENCVLSLVAKKFGLCVQASRSVTFGQPEVSFRRDHDAACKVSATYIASTWPDAVPRQILASGRRIYQLIGAEHEWLQCPQGHVTGRAPVELEMTPQTEELLENNSVVSWQVSVGSAMSADSFLISEEGPKIITSIENWPVKRIRIQGAEFLRPDLLVR
jgi:Xaa-Pro dipeptidase